MCAWPVKVGNFGTFADHHTARNAENFWKVRSLWELNSINVGHHFYPLVFFVWYWRRNWVRLSAGGFGCCILLILPIPTHRRPSLGKPNGSLYACLTILGNSFSKSEQKTSFLSYWPKQGEIDVLEAERPWGYLSNVGMAKSSGDFDATTGLYLLTNNGFVMSKYFIFLNKVFVSSFWW